MAHLEWVYESHSKTRPWVCLVDCSTLPGRQLSINDIISQAALNNALPRKMGVYERTG